MRGLTCATPTATDFTPAGSTVDIPVSTHAVSEDSYRGDTILPSVEVPDHQPSINTLSGSSLPPSKTTVSTRLSSTLSWDSSSRPPPQSTCSGVSSTKGYQGSFTFRSLYNATPESTPGLSDRSSQPLTGANKEYFSGQSRQSEACVQGLSNRLQRLDIDACSGSGDKVFYDVKDEVPPSEPYFDPAFQKALKNGLQLAGKVGACLQQCDLAQKVDSDLHKLFKTARELESFESPATRIIGIVGDSATGNACPEQGIGMMLTSSAW